jgi:glycosyltransferase involved in cell wall biosynthesis
VSLAAGPVRLTVNGRFLVQPQSGVQRFAMETARALKAEAPSLGFEAPVILMPPVREPSADAVLLGASSVGRMSGQAWEQIELPRKSAGRILINLGNTAPIFKARQIVVIHDAGVFRRPEAYTWKFRAWYKTLQRVLAAGRTRLVTVSEFSKSEISMYLHCPPNTISVIGEAADHMRRVVPDPSILLAHGLGARPFVLAVGNLAAHKNLAALDETASRLAAHGAVLAITGSLDRGVFDKAAAPFSPHALYLGRVSDGELAALYQHAQCFIFPSTYEGFGLPALEAMEFACPVVASDIPSLREVCGDAAVYVDPHSPAGIATAVEKLLQDDDFRRDLGQKGLQHCARYSWALTSRNLLSVILAMADHHSAPKI